MTDRQWYEDAPLPRLLREARDVYRGAIQQALSEVGCDDIPRSGVLVLAALDYSGPEPSFSPQAEIVASLGLTRQAASQLADTLVLRDYLERRVDPEDRRRMELRATARGRIAALAIRRSIDAVDAALAERITATELHGLRAGLAALRELRDVTPSP